jgi:hypothetical protein
MNIYSLISKVMILETVGTIVISIIEDIWIKRTHQKDARLAMVIAKNVQGRLIISAQNVMTLANF